MVGRTAARTVASTPTAWTPTENEGEQMKLTSLGTGSTVAENGGGTRWRLLVVFGSLAAAGLACGNSSTIPANETNGGGSSGGADAGSISGSGGSSDGGGTGSAAVGGGGDRRRGQLQRLGRRRCPHRGRRLQWRWRRQPVGRADAADADCSGGNGPLSGRSGAAGGRGPFRCLGRHRLRSGPAGGRSALGPRHPGRRDGDRRLRAGGRRDRLRRRRARRQRGDRWHGHGSQDHRGRQSLPHRDAANGRPRERAAGNRSRSERHALSDRRAGRQRCQRRRTRGRHDPCLGQPDRRHRSAVQRRR